MGESSFVMVVLAAVSVGQLHFASRPSLADRRACAPLAQRCLPAVLLVPFFATMAAYPGSEPKVMLAAFGFRHFGQKTIADFCATTGHPLVDLRRTMALTRQAAAVGSNFKGADDPEFVTSVLEQDGFVSTVRTILETTIERGQPLLFVGDLKGSHEAFVICKVVVGILNRITNDHRAPACWARFQSFGRAESEEHAKQLLKGAQMWMSSTGERPKGSFHLSRQSCFGCSVRSIVAMSTVNQVHDMVDAMMAQTRFKAEANVEEELEEAEPIVERIAPSRQQRPSDRPRGRPAPTPKAMPIIKVPAPRTPSGSPPRAAPTPRGFRRPSPVAGSSFDAPIGARKRTVAAAVEPPTFETDEWQETEWGVEEEEEDDIFATFDRDPNIWNAQLKDFGCDEMSRRSFFTLCQHSERGLREGNRILWVFCKKQADGTAIVNPSALLQVAVKDARHTLAPKYDEPRSKRRRGNL